MIFAFYWLCFWITVISMVIAWKGFIRRCALEEIIQDMKEERRELWDKLGSNNVDRKELERVYKLNDALLLQCASWKTRWKQVLTDKHKGRVKLP